MGKHQDLADVRPGASAVLASAAAAYANTCQSDPVMLHMGTMNVVRDLEVLRRAVGDAGLTYLGVSYGTEVGILYADMYPTHVRAMIIDGVVNPAHGGEDILVSQAVGWQKGLEAFFVWCKENAGQCLISADPEGGFRQMQALAHSQPATLHYKGGPITLSSGWVTLLSVLVWTSCMDQPLRRGDAYEAMVTRAAAAAPLTGAVQANINRPCVYLPVDPDPVRRDYKAQGFPAIMVWGSTGDPATPYQNSQEAVAQLSNASLFTFVANQHVAMGGGPECKACVVDVQSRISADGDT
ncbi:alpha/beta fold hydrolase [Alcaligenaceae bacterium]|nr:alpha/beta fold hydrolase [Alcaligenaceae bacterium]